MRKILTFLFAALMSVGMWAAPIVVERVQIGDLYYNLNNGNQTAEVTYKSFTNYTFNEGWDITTANIPASVEYYSVTYSVTSIGDQAFAHCTGLTSITIPNGVTSIGEDAFYGCTGLTSVTIPNGVTSIGEGAFEDCTGLTSIEIPNSVEYIGYRAFSYTGLTSIIIPNSVTSIGEDVFKSCSSLTSIEIPNSVTSIGWCAFQFCSSLTSITIPSSVEYIGEGAFFGCTNIADVYCYPNAEDLTWNEEDCNDFKDNKATVCHVNSDQLSAYESKFTGVVNVTFVGDLDAPAQPAWVLEGDEWDETTKTLTVNSNLPNNAYKNNTEIEHVIINNSVTSIGYAAFRNCTALTSIEIPNGVTSIDGWTFGSCSNLESVTIPSSVTSIGAAAFGECTSLTSIEIPNSVTSIDEQAFAASGLTSITIPNSVEYIGGGAFWYCTGLTSVTISNSITSIETSTFESCTGLTSIEIPNSVTSIGMGAFAGCGLTSITIPNSVTSIGEGAFYYCTGLTSVTNYATTPQTIESNVFGEVDLSSCTLYVPAESASAYSTASVWQDFGTQSDIVPTNVDPENPSYYYSTFFHSTQNYKLTNDGTTAFIADLSGNDLILTEIAKGSQVIPANTAVILRKAGSAEPVALTPTEENGVSVNPEDNDLEGVDAITAVTSIDGLTRDNCYVLSGQQSVGFYLINSDNLKAHKAYVKYVSTPGQNNAPKKMRFVFNTTTGVESAQPSVISGQKLIENGQLIIIKNGVKYNAQGQIVK